MITEGKGLKRWLQEENKEWTRQSVCPGCPRESDLVSRGSQGLRSPLESRRVHGGGSAPSCCAFTHRVAFEEGSGPGLGTEHLPGALCSGTGSPALGLCSAQKESLTLDQLFPHLFPMKCWDQMP